MTSREIASKIVLKILANEYRPNQKLPSEQQIAIKYHVSRIVATKVYSTLKSIGAVYSVPKRGFFVAEHFANLMQSVNQTYKIDHFIDTTLNLNQEIFLKQNNIEWEYFCFERKHYRKGELIAISKNWLNEDVCKYQENQDFVIHLTKKQLLESGYNILRFEKFPAFGQELNLVLTNIYYGFHNVAYVQKIVIKPQIFRFFKNEWVI